MKNILDKLISRLDGKLSDGRQDNPNEETIVGMFQFGRHHVRYVFKPKGCELEIWNPILDVFLDNVAFYCEARVIKWDSIDVSEISENDYNGFSNEADYLRYRYE